MINVILYTPQKHCQADMNFQQRNLQLCQRKERKVILKSCMLRFEFSQSKSGTLNHFQHCRLISLHYQPKCAPPFPYRHMRYPAETSEILVSREFFFHFHFSFSISSRFNFTFISRKRVKAFYFSLFTSQKK